MKQPSNQQTLQQKRASHAYARVNSLDVEQVTEALKKKYGTLAHRLPAMIQTDGLGASLAFLQAKGEEHHLFAYSHLSDWLAQPEQFGFNSDLLTWVLMQPTSVYRQVTNETLAYLVWIKRFAEAKNWSDDPNAT